MLPSATAPPLAESLSESLVIARDGAPLAADVDRLGVIAFEGADAATFLHGQLSCHVTELAPGQSSWGAYSTPQGRMLASFVLARGPSDLLMLLDRSIVPAIAKRLRMYVLRAKVTVTDRSDDWAVLGIANLAPAEIDPGATLRWFALGPARQLGVGPRPARDAIARPRVDPAAWDWLDVRDGFPWITLATQDALVPQMVNLERIGGVHFQKGCYPGQEIVARTQYLGKGVKRRMIRAHVATESAPEPATPVFGTEFGDGQSSTAQAQGRAQAAGLIVGAAPSPEGGFEVLAVVLTSALANGGARLGALDGPRLDPRPLPYTLD